MVNAQKALQVVVAVFVVGIIAASLMPVVIGEVTSTTTTLEQTEGNTYQVATDIESTIDSIETGTATVTVTTSDGSDTVSVSEGDTATASIAGNDIDVTATEVGTTTATIQYEYAVSVGLGGAIGSMWSILPFFIILPVFLFITYMAINKA